MKIEDFYVLQEHKDKNKVKFDFWIDQLGDFRIDIKDDETIMDYLKKRSDILSKDYEEKIDRRRVEDLSPEEVVKKMGWFLVTLLGDRATDYLNDLKEKEKKIPLKYLVYKKAIIRHPYKHASNIEKDLSLKEIIKKLQRLYGTVEEIITIDRDGTVKQYVVKNKERLRKWIPRKIKV
jgi:hypothetical protein